MFNENIYNSNIYKKKYKKNNYKKVIKKNFKKSTKVNSEDIKQNSEDIKQNSNNINQNSNDINQNSNDINQNSDDINQNSDDIKLNTENTNLNNDQFYENYNNLYYNPDTNQNNYENSMNYYNYYYPVNYNPYDYMNYNNYFSTYNNPYQQNYYLTNHGLISPKPIIENNFNSTLLGPNIINDFYSTNLKDNFTSTEDFNNENNFISELINQCIDDILENKNIVIPKEKKWINFCINSLDDLINVAKDYGNLYSVDFEYNINLKLLSEMVPELENLNKLIGLSKIKNQIVDIILYYSLKLDNKNHDMLHTVIEGEPGTGKTELAEKLASIYLKMGLLTSTKFKKVKRSDLIAGYLGQTAIKTEKILEECKGGVLFIDEAYSLGNAEGKDGKDSFSKECIDLLNQYLTENKNNFVCIIAGYKDDLKKSFFSFNSGLERRFPIRFAIDSYKDEELAKIFIKKVKECEWDINSSNLDNFIKKNRKYFKYNGGDMENLFAKCKISHSKNLLKIENKPMKVINDDDIELGFKIYLENPEVKERDNNIDEMLKYTMYC